MNGFTAIRDLDKELLLKMDTRSFIVTCNVNKYFIDLCKSDNYLIFKRRLQLYYPDTVKTYKANWKDYYGEVVRTVALLKERHDFDYSGGDPFLQLAYFTDYKMPKMLLLQALKEKEIHILFHLAKKFPSLLKPYYINLIKQAEELGEFPSGTSSHISKILIKSSS